MSQRELCNLCGGNGVMKIHHGVSVCPRCRGDYYEPPEAMSREAEAAWEWVKARTDPWTGLDVDNRDCHCLFCQGEWEHKADCVWVLIHKPVRQLATQPEAVE